jgi:hypothetical protein
MSKPPIDREYFIGRWLFGLFGLLALIMIGSIMWDIHAGVAHTKSGTILRENDPQGFWIEMLIDAGIVLLFAYFAFRFRRYVRKRPSPPSA